MIFINPQWQGSGESNELRLGAETMKEYFQNLVFTEIPLSSKSCSTIEDVICLEPILEQSISFRNLVEDSRAKKISTIGGDCGIEIVPISYLNSLYEGDMCVIWIDSHADLNTPESSPSKTFHGMPLRTLLGEGNRQIKDLLFSTISTEQVVFVGLRDLDDAESEYIERHKIASFSKCEYSEIKTMTDKFEYVYVHLDLDVLDETEYEYTLFPSPNGVLINEVAQLLSDIKENCNVVGICITESTATSLEELSKIKPILDHIVLE